MEFIYPEGTVNMPAETTFDIEQGEYINRPTEDPQKEGEKFDNWYTEETGGELFRFEAPIEQNTFIYGRWKEKIQVFFWIGEEYTEGTVFAGECVVPPTPDTPKGYSFEGWFYDRNFELPFDPHKPAEAGDPLLLYAYFKPNIISVTFDTQGGSPCEAVEVLYNEPLSPLPASQREGYNFLGWYYDKEATRQYRFNPITEPTTLYAGWERIAFIVTFKPGQMQVVSPQKVYYGETVTRPDTLIVNGWTFKGWSTVRDLADSLFDFSTPIYKKLTLYGLWENAALTPIMQGSLAQIIVTPNPFHNHIKVRNIPPQSRYRLLTAVGQIAREGVTETNSTGLTITTEKLANGVYVLQILSQQGEKKSFVLMRR